MADKKPLFHWSKIAATHELKSHKKEEEMKSCFIVLNEESFRLPFILRGISLTDHGCIVDDQHQRLSSIYSLDPCPLDRAEKVKRFKTKTWESVFF